MKYRYTRRIADLADEIDLESLMSHLSDLLLSSGFNNPWDPQNDDDRTMQALHDAILDALLNGGAISEDLLNQLLSDATDPGRDGDEQREQKRSQIEQLVQQIMERLTEQGYISVTGKPESRQPQSRAAASHRWKRPARAEGG